MCQKPVTCSLNKKSIISAWLERLTDQLCLSTPNKMPHCLALLEARPRSQSKRRVAALVIWLSNVFGTIAQVIYLQLWILWTPTENESIVAIHKCCKLCHCMTVWITPITLCRYSTIVSLLLYDSVTVSLQSILVTIRTVLVQLCSQIQWASIHIV